MSAKDTSRAARLRRHGRVRKRVSGVAARPRLCLFRSLNHIYAQVIDDVKGHTVASASDLDASLRNGSKAMSKVDVAGQVGGLVAQRALAEGIKRVVFDRGGFKYHGRVKALADAARSAGLEF